MPLKYQSIKYPLGVTFAWLVSIGVLTSIFTDIEKAHRNEDKALIAQLREQNSRLMSDNSFIKMEMERKYTKSLK